jgi:hypothetical protein
MNPMRKIVLGTVAVAAVLVGTLGMPSTSEAGHNRFGVSVNFGPSCDYQPPCTTGYGYRSYYAPTYVSPVVTAYAAPAPVCAPVAVPTVTAYPVINGGVYYRAGYPYHHHHHYYPCR